MRRVFTNVRWRWLCAAGAAVSFFLLACQESLPGRHDPGSLFTGILAPTYVHAWNENDVVIMAGIVNTYDETLQDTADMRGSLLVTLLRKPSVTRMIPITRDSLMPGQYQYDGRTKILTIGPGDTVWIRAHWDLRDDDGRDLRMEEFTYYRDELCYGRMYAYEENFAIAGSVQVFPEHGQVVLNSSIFRLCYVTPYVGPKDCPKASSDCLSRD